MEVRKGKITTFVIQIKNMKLGTYNFSNTKILIIWGDLEGQYVERFEYGNNPLANNIGKIETIFNQSGMTVFEEYDFKGNTIVKTNLFCEKYQNLIDWNQHQRIQIDFRSNYEYDALNRPVAIFNHYTGGETQYTYDKGGKLQTVTHNGHPHIENITYNARGQRKNIYYGNNSKTRYNYNPLNFRLERLLTTRHQGQDFLQDLNYEYDAVGNIVYIRDDAQQEFYFDNSIIQPENHYQYDALYRLIEATGRECLAFCWIPTEEDFPNDFPVPSDPSAMSNYHRYYTYDALGNILTEENHVGGNSWNRDFVYIEGTNQLWYNQIGSSAYYTGYDPHGNMVGMPHLNYMHWDYDDNLSAASNYTFYSYYSYDEQGNRTRKVVEKGHIREERYYLDGYEIFRIYESGQLTLERHSTNLVDDEKVFARIDEGGQEGLVTRYQYDNHLGSACLELDENAEIISYEEYHPFGTTSYRSGRDKTEVSLKRYK